jgi:hypothetical protein
VPFFFSSIFFLGKQEENGQTKHRNKINFVVLWNETNSLLKRDRHAIARDDIAIEKNDS